MKITKYLTVLWLLTFTMIIRLIANSSDFEDIFTNHAPIKILSVEPQCIEITGRDGKKVGVWFNIDNHCQTAITHINGKKIEEIAGYDNIPGGGMTPEEKLKWAIADQVYSLVYDEKGYAYNRPRFSDVWQINGTIGEQKMIIKGETKLTPTIKWLFISFFSFSLLTPLLLLGYCISRIIRFFQRTKK